MNLFINFIIKEFILLKRYIFNSLAGGITLVIIFYIIFQGYNVAAGGNIIGSTIEGLIVSYIVWISAISSFQDVTNTIQEEKKEGTISQLFMARFNLVRVLITKIFAQFMLNFGLIIFMLFVSMLITNHYLKFNIIETLCIYFIINLNYWGIGFLFGGLSLVYKRAQSALQIMQFAFMALIIAPVNVSIIKYLPSTWGIELLKRIVDNYTYSISINDILLLVVPSILYFIMGIMLFQLFKKKAIRKGIVEHY